VKNGVGREHAGFTPWFWSYRLAARIEAVVVVCVIAGVVAILALLFRMPGPLVVHVQDDKKEAVMGARVRCTSPDRQSSHAGSTDVFGEAKWPGLLQGAWRCEALPPPKFHTGPMIGYATVVPRKPAMWMARLERPATAVVQVVRPRGEPRAAPAVRALCQQAPGEDAPPTWESRAGLLDGRAALYLPHGRACRVGLVRPELPPGQPGPVADAKLACDRGPCTPELRGGVGEELQITLAPTRAQWAAVRPPPEPD